MKDKKKNPVPLEGFDFEAFQREAIKQLKAGKPIGGKDGVLTPLIKQIVESALKGELQAHLDEEPTEAKNRKNGKSSKTMRSDYGSFELETPGDRSAEAHLPDGPEHPEEVDHGAPELGPDCFAVVSIL